MALSFIKDLFGVEGGYRAVKASYDKHYAIAVKQGIEPISIALFGALGSRYKLRRKFKSDQIHMLEIVPFAMMGYDVRLETLADYLMLDEIPAKIDESRLRGRINDALRTRDGEFADDAYELLVASLPYLEGTGIRWLAWVDDANAQQLREDFEKTENEE